MKYLLSILIVCLFVATQCEEQAEANKCDEGATVGRLSDLTGLDGCRWVIVVDSSKRYQPTNLGDFDIKLEDGKEICFTYVEKPSMASICMVGPIIELKTLQ